MKKRYITLLFLCFTMFLQGQKTFQFSKVKTKKQRVKFKFINNLIIIPLEINGKELSFILDSGVNKTILFNLSKNDSVGLNNVKTVELKGLGGSRVANALISKNNQIKLGKIKSSNENIYVILKDYFDLSGRMGETIHGIIGYSLFKNFITKINYNTKKIDFYNPKYYTLENCRGCKTLPIQFYRNKPFIDGRSLLDSSATKPTHLKLLIDTGGSDAVWLFEQTKPEITSPKKYFKDILGEGLSGTIYGKRSRLQTLQLSSFVFKNPTVSYLDTTTTVNARRFTDRNGSIGGEILKRFTVWLDYPNKKLMLKKNSYFRKDFNYNMSGLDIVYSGKILIREQELTELTDGFDQSISNNNSVRFVSSFTYKFRPSFMIKDVVPESPAFKAGLLKDDLILRINNRPAHEYKLGEILAMFQEKENKRIKMTIDRKGVRMKFEFYLRKKI